MDPDLGISSASEGEQPLVQQTQIVAMPSAVSSEELTPTEAQLNANQLPADEADLYRDFLSSQSQGSSPMRGVAGERGTALRQNVVEGIVPDVLPNGAQSPLLRSRSARSDRSEPIPGFSLPPARSGVLMSPNTGPMGRDGRVLISPLPGIRVHPAQDANSFMQGQGRAQHSVGEAMPSSLAEFRLAAAEQQRLSGRDADRLYHGNTNGSRRGTRGALVPPVPNNPLPSSMPDSDMESETTQERRAK